MEIMEDGNLVDRVRILLQRDMQYYQDMQTVLREPLCVRVSGGKFDFPRHASFAAIKIVTWWEAEFTLAFKCPSGLSSVSQDNGASLGDDDGVVKKTLPSDFLLLVVETSEQLLDHLHLLIQESLDHADLTVLTATLGAAALVRNCLWCYNQRAKNKIPEHSSAKLLQCYKSYNEMAEAVAERLLDLHCRLISLYILNEADSLNWQCDRAFFEKERCSYIIQMWWLYMQAIASTVSVYLPDWRLNISLLEGTKTDLWNTVSPKMAQRVFSGMLNESLSIIVARFIHGRPSLARSVQFWADAFNVLCCTAYLALSVCVSGDEMIGSNVESLSAYARDIHAKCNELLICLLLRGAPLGVLYQVFRKGMDNLTITKPRSGPAPWVYICTPNLFGIYQTESNGFQDLSEGQAAILELYVLKCQPQPNWPQLIKVLSMDNYTVGSKLLGVLVSQCAGYTSLASQLAGDSAGDNECGGFLCAGNSCRRSLRIGPPMGLHALVYIVAGAGCDAQRVLLPALKRDPAWATYLDRQQVWNQARPPWLNALVAFFQPIMTPIVDILLEAVKTGASTYQAMSLALVCFSELYECLPLGVLQTALVIDDNMPAHCRPIGGSVFLQLMCSALYSGLLEASAEPTPGRSSEQSSSVPEIRIQEPGVASTSSSRSSLAQALAEALCGIDEHNKHTAQIEAVVGQVRAGVRRRPGPSDQLRRLGCVIETLTDELAFTEIGRRSLKIVHEYVLRCWKPLLELVRGKPVEECRLSGLEPVAAKPLCHTMFLIEEGPFDRLLAEYESFPWQHMFELPLAVSEQRVRAQVLSRPELLNILGLEQDEREAALCVKQLCTTGTLNRRN